MWVNVASSLASPAGPHLGWHRRSVSGGIVVTPVSRSHQGLPPARSARQAAMAACGEAARGKPSPWDGFDRGLAGGRDRPGTMRQEGEQ